MLTEPSGDYYDFTKTMQPERPWRVDWHQRFVYRIMHAIRGGLGTKTANPKVTANRPWEHRHVYGDGKMAYLCLTYEQSLEVIRRVHDLTCGMPQVVLLTGWQFEGHDSKYPSWAEPSEHLKRPQDATAVESLRWLIREARKYNCLATLHVNMFDAYEDSPLFEEYLAKDIFAKDTAGQPIVGNRWWGMDCYHISYTQEWKHGLAQKRIDDLLAMLPEVQENQCIYVDAFLGARMAEQKGPISPYLGYSKEEEARTQRKILRYWRDKGVDPACEHVWGMRVDRFVGLQPYSAAQMELIADLPHALYTSSPFHPEFRSINPMPEFNAGYFLKTFPYYYKNHHEGTGDLNAMIDGTDICMPALWCKTPTVLAYSKEGYAGKSWQLPASWAGVSTVNVQQLAFAGCIELGDVNIVEQQVTLSLKPGQAVKMTRRE